MAKDAAANVASTGAATVQVDNTPPAGPVGLAGGPTWSTSAMRNLQWTLPGGQVAPISGAQVQVCKQGGGCFDPGATTTSSSFMVPSEGAYTATVKLVDAAGNVTVTGGSLAFGWDASAPPAPGLGSVQPAGGSTYTLPVNTGNDPGPAPVTSLVGEVCRQGAGDCQPFFAAGSPPTSAELSLPAAGTWTIAVRAVDAAGNTSPSATTSYTVTTAPTPTATPTLTPTATPAVRRRPHLKLTKVRLTRTRVIVRGRLAARATGVVTIAARGRKRALPIGAGNFAGSVKLPRRARGTRRVQLVAAYEGDSGFLPRTRIRVVRRR